MTERGGFSSPVELGLMPRPKYLIQQDGRFSLSSSTTLKAPAALKSMAVRLREYLAPATGLKLPESESATEGVIELSLDPAVKSLGNEGYRLQINSTRVLITGATPRGVFYGIQTLRQLLPVEAFAPTPQKQKWSVPAVWIEDVPRFEWRGAMLDVCRHFMPKEFVKKYIDTLALHKLNTFHWHLTDDQGWRIEIKRYPNLTKVGSFRKGTQDGHYTENKVDTKPYGGFYTQEDIKEIVRYAADRFVNVVPEIEMPGHAQAAIASYPELGNTGKQIEVATQWGVIEDVLNVEDSTVQFMKNVLEEVMQLFPSKFIHVGGDECNKTQWKKSERAQAKKKLIGAKTEEELQSWFIKQIDTYLDSKGRRLIGWDEILEGGLAPGAAVMSWRGEDGGIAAASAGHDVVMASNNAFYFDYYQAPKAGEPLAIGGFLPLKKVYDYEVVPAKLSAEKRKHVIGGQFQIWTEYIAESSKVEYMAFPRACAASELYWSPREGKNHANFLGRLAVHVGRLSQLGVNFRKLDAEVPTAAKWSAGEVSNDYKIKTWDVTPSIKSPGKFEVRFQYTGGAFRLDVDGIEILVDGVVVASDKHYGRTGAVDVDNIWRVDVASLGKKVELRAKVRADGGEDSNGEITISPIAK